MEKESRRLCPLAKDTKLKGHRLFSEVLANLSDQYRDWNNARSFTDEKSEYVLEKATMKQRADQWAETRHKDLVYEDHFNPSVISMAKKGAFCFDKLIQVCKKYENRAQIEEHGRLSEGNYSMFERSIPLVEDAKAAAFAISFYTGSQSGGISRGASIIARQGNGEVLNSAKEEDVDDAAIILYYMVKGLSNIPFYWGVSARAIDLNDDESNSYAVGNVVTWFQFSSSKKGYEPPKFFENRNTHFIIYSLTGRSIQKFSSFQEEDEILFLPHSTFLVIDRKEESVRSKIYLRQIEVGFSEWTILWVDDKIFDPDWENKRHMERVSSHAMNQNVHIIPKSCTESGLSFLRSPFGQRLKNCDKFRIVSDMKRDNETSGRYAGIHFLKAIRQLGFKNRFLIFTGSQKKATEKIQVELTEAETQNLLVAELPTDLDTFVAFEN